MGIFFKPGGSRARSVSLPGSVHLFCVASLFVSALIECACGRTNSSPATPPANIVVNISPSTVSVPAGGAQVFTASVSGPSGVTWSVNEIPNGNSTVGTIVATSSTTALYTAPASVPSPAVVSVTAASTADASESASASVTITCASANSISPPSATVDLGQTQAFTGSFCLAAGASIAWDVNGIAGGNATLGTIVTTAPNAALYTAPADLPSSNPVTIHATASAAAGGNPATAFATVTIASDISVSISPPTATLSLGQRASFTPTVPNASDASVTWSVNGVPNGNGSIGQICQSGTNPCVAPAGPASGAVDYLAPTSVPASNPVTLVATSHADPSRSGTAMVTISGSSSSIAVAVSPPYAFVPPSTGAPSTHQFFTNVTGTSDTSVTWSVASAGAGQGCAGAGCGSVNSSGLYSAPSATPSPNAISVIATSMADPTKSASATVALTNGPVIEMVLPSSAMAGAVESFPLSVQGAGFAVGSGSSASVILINGAPRSTTCASVTACTTSLNPTDVQSVGTLTLQVQNPGAPPALSNPVPFVVVPFDVSVATIALSVAQPVAAGEDILVVEPTTAAASSPINVDFIGLLTGGNTCGVQGSPLTISRPSSGSATVSICVHGSGLDPAFTYAFTGPAAPPNVSDVGVSASAIAGLFPNMIELDLQITSATLPGVRTLLITTPNNDCAAATGMLEVQ
jgi:hypothetical protein